MSVINRTLYTLYVVCMSWTDPQNFQQHFQSILDIFWIFESHWLMAIVRKTNKRMLNPWTCSNFQSHLIWPFSNYMYVDSWACSVSTRTFCWGKKPNNFYLMLIQLAHPANIANGDFRSYYKTILATEKSLMFWHDFISYACNK